MPTPSSVRHLLARLKRLREKSRITPQELEQRLILGPGWIERIESGEIAPTIDLLLAILHALGKTLMDLGPDPNEDASGFGVDRYLVAEPAPDDPHELLVKFPYGKHDAIYRLKDATIEEFDAVIKEMRNGLARLVAVPEDEEEAVKAIKVEAVARTFLTAARLWRDANPSDLWTFIVSRAYYDPFNHPADYARLNLDQSWKRTGGWALEEVFVRHYAPFLAKHGVRIHIASNEEKRAVFGALKLADRLEVDKVDVMLSGERDGKAMCFGVCHVKASIAERRTDDVPLSRALIDGGFTSPFLTMDCKSGPSEDPVNRGELGEVLGAAKDQRSAKRKDIEDDGYFSACFSYNANTFPTPARQRAKARIYVCDFRNPDDSFAQFIIAEWKRFVNTRLAGRKR